MTARARSGSSGGEGGPLDDVPLCLADLIGPLVRDLGALAEAASSAIAGRMPVEVATVSGLREDIARIIRRHGDVLGGCGVVLAPEHVAEGDRHLEWWWVPPHGAPEQLRTNLDLSAPDSYDYAVAPWFTEGMRCREVLLDGPYQDVACSNQYVMTVARPVLVEGRPVALAAADLPMERLERRLVRGLLREPGARALLNPHGRVVATVDAELLPGSLAIDAPTDGGSIRDGRGHWRVLRREVSERRQPAAQATISDRASGST